MAGSPYHHAHPHGTLSYTWECPLTSVAYNKEVSQVWMGLRGGEGSVAAQPFEACNPKMVCCWRYPQ